MGFKIRSATPDEVLRLPDIEQQASELFAGTAFANVVGLECLSVDFLNEQQRAGRLWVAVTQGERLVGFAVATIVDGNAHLHELSVNPDHARRGIGRALVETACHWAANEGHSLITLSTFRDIPWNAPFYRTIGFETVVPKMIGTEMIALRQREAEDGLDIESRIVMAKKL